MWFIDNFSALTWLLDLVFKVTLLLSLTLLAERKLANRSAAFKHCLWLACFTGLVALPVASLLLPTVPLPLLTRAEPQVPSLIQTQANTTSSNVGVNRAIKSQLFQDPQHTANHQLIASDEASSLRHAIHDTNSDQQASATPQLVSTTIAAWMQSAAQFVLIVWIVGIGFSLTPLCIGFWNTFRLNRHSRSLSTSSLLLELKSLSNTFPLTRSVELRESDAGLVPMTWGILRPTILLPSPLWHAWTTEQRQIVLLHELAHIKRLDVLYQAFSRLVCSLYWFHPLVWHGHRQMRLSREQACDDYVLTHGVSSSVYAQHLLNVARQSRTPPTLIAVAMAQQSGLERRIRSILNSSRSRLPLSKRASQATLLAFIFGAALIAVPKISTGTMPQDKAASEKATPSKSQASDDGATKAEKTDTPNQPDDQPLVAAPNELVGIVVDSAGKPVAGASVDAWSWYPGNETETDANGQFRLKLDDPRAKIELRISKEGYSPVYIPQQPIGFAHFKATLGQKTYIEGTVRDANGSPVANTEVRGEFGPVEADGVMIGFVATKTKTDTQGHYRLFVNPQTYQLQVRTDSGQVARLTGITVQADEGKLQDIALEQGVRFEATVIDSISKQPFPDFVLHHFMHPGIVGRSDSQGKLIIEGMLPGQFEFNIGEGDTQQLGPFKTYMPRTIGRWWSPQAKQPWQREEIKAGEFQRNLDDLTFDLKQGMEPITIYVEKAVTITGRVTDPNGKPVEGATVAPAKSGSGNSLTGDTRFSVKTDADGRYEAIMPAGKDFQYNLVVHDGEYQQWRNWANGVTDPFATQPGERLENVNLQLTQPATVRGRVIANGNQKVGDREIRAHAKDLRENRYYDPTTRTKDDGTFELKFIRPGEHLIQVAPFWLAAGNAPNGSSAAVSLEPGQVVDGIELTIVEQVQQANMNVAKKLEFTILLTDEHGEPLPDTDIILSSLQKPADLSVLIGDKTTLKSRWSQSTLGGEVRQTNAKGILKVSGNDVFDQFAAPVTVAAMDIERGYGAIGALVPAQDRTNVTLKLQPLQELRVKFDDSDIRVLDDSDKQAMLVALATESAQLAQTQVTERDIVIQLPPGNYGIFAMHPLTEMVNKTVSVKQSSLPAPQDPVVIKLQLNRIAKMIGHEALPLRDLVAWKENESTELTSLRGKVVILDFWGHWCGPCVSSMPELMKLHDEYHERGLEIIAIHDNSVTSMEELDKQLETTRRDLWNGRSLPFRVAIAGLNPDNPSAAQATVIADYGITQFPTTLLIDRSGKVIRQLNAYQTEENRKLIKGLLE